MADSIRRTITYPYVSQVVRADPKWGRESKEVVEYEFSGGEVKKGVTASRGPYA